MVVESWVFICILCCKGIVTSIYVSYVKQFLTLIVYSHWLCPGRGLILYRSHSNWLCLRPELDIWKPLKCNWNTPPETVSGPEKWVHNPFFPVQCERWFLKPYNPFRSRRQPVWIHIKLGCGVFYFQHCGMRTYLRYCCLFPLTASQVSNDIPKICPGCDSHNRIRLHTPFYDMRCLS